MILQSGVAHAMLGRHSNAAEYRPSSPRLRPSPKIQRHVDDLDIAREHYAARSGITGRL
jgi:hypothetical protein